MYAIQWENIWLIEGNNLYKEFGHGKRKGIASV
jgi:hypothetical protein